MAAVAERARAELGAAYSRQDQYGVMSAPPARQGTIEGKARAPVRVVLNRSTRKLLHHLPGKDDKVAVPIFALSPEDCRVRTGDLVFTLKKGTNLDTSTAEDTFSSLAGLTENELADITLLGVSDGQPGGVQSSGSFDDLFTYNMFGTAVTFNTGAQDILPGRFLRWSSPVLVRSPFNPHVAVTSHKLVGVSPNKVFPSVEPVPHADLYSRAVEVIDSVFLGVQLSDLPETSNRRLRKLCTKLFDPENVESSILPLAGAESPAAAAQEATKLAKDDDGVVDDGTAQLIGVAVAYIVELLEAKEGKKKEATQAALISMVRALAAVLEADRADERSDRIFGVALTKAGPNKPYEVMLGRA